MARTTAKLTIGLPVRNGAGSVGPALEALLAQRFRDFELIVSDNASGDATGEICRRYAERDERVHYFRQERNTGALENFDFVLQKAETPYFMWAGCDDLWLPDFAGRNLEALEARPDYVCSVSRAEFMDAAGAPLERKGGTYPLEGSPEDNLVRFLESPEANTRFYGVQRTQVVRRCFSPKEVFLAADWVVMARTLSFGKHHEVPEVLIRRGSGGASSDVTAHILATNPSWISRRWLPMLPMSRKILFDPLMPRDREHLRRILTILRKKNRRETRHHRAQLRRRAEAGRARPEGVAS